MQAEAKVVQKKVTKLKQLMHWDGEELLAWEDLHNRKEEDIYLLQQFINEDTAQFKVSHYSPLLDCLKQLSCKY